MVKDRTVGVPTGYKVKLNVSERLNLSTLFPKAGNILANQVMEDITEKVKLSTNELAVINFKTVDVPTPKGMTSQSSWNPKKLKDKQVHFTNTEMKFLKKRIEVLDKAEGITSNMWPIVKKLDAFKVSEEKN